jgi:DNA-binding winged helix-turn-helix (wHTH) protein/Tol biopolymer transport system component
LNNNEILVSSNTKRILKIGEWQVLPWQNCLIKGEQTKSIEPQCMALLIFLAQHQGQVISRAELLDTLWKNVVVNENTLTKTVGMLRQALEDDVKQPQYIVTRIKKGYQLIATVLELNEDIFESAKLALTEPELTKPEIIQPDLHHKTTTEISPEFTSLTDIEANIDTIQPITNDVKTHSIIKTSNKKLWLITIVTVSFLALLVSIFWQELPSKTLAYKKFSPVTFGEGIEQDPNFSPDGKFLIYSKRNHTSPNYNLAIYSIEQKISVPVSDFIGDELAPAFSPDGKNIAYFHKNNAVCHLYVSEFTYPNTITKGKKVASCGYNNQGKVHWLDDDLLLYSDRNIETMGEHKLYKVQLSSLFIKEVKGHYPFAFSVSPNKENIAMLERHHGHSNLDINTLSLQQKKSKTWLKGLTYFSEFAWLNDEKRLLITDTYYGSISITDDNGGSQKIHQANMMFSQPVVNPVSDVVALVQSSIKSNVYQINNPLLQVKTDKSIDYFSISKPLLASNYFDYLHQYSPDKKLSAFVSNRSGEHQLWISKEGVESPVIKELLAFGNIINFSWSADASKILLMLSDNKVLLYTLKDRSVFELPLGKGQIYYPIWDSQGNAVLFARMNEMGPKISRYDIDTHIEQQLTNTGAISIAVSPDGRYLYLLKLKSELWQLDRFSGEEKIILANISPSSRGSLLAFNDGIYWQELTSTHYKIKHFKFNTAQTSDLMTVPQDNSFHLRYFDVSSDQSLISFHRMYDYRSDLVFLSE